MNLVALDVRLRWLDWIKRSGEDAFGLGTSWDGGSIDRNSLGIYKHALQEGDTLHMNQRFCELVDYARQTIPDDLAFEEEWMVTPSGFMWLEEPFIVPAPTLTGMTGKALATAKDFFRADSCRISAIAWFKIPASAHTKAKYVSQVDGREVEPGSAWEFCCFHEPYFGKAAGRGFTAWSYFALTQGDRVLDRVHAFEKFSAEELTGGAYAEGRATDMLHEIRWIFTAMHMMSQKLATTRDEPVNAAMRKLIKREELKINPIVRTVTLRRLEQDRAVEEHHAVDWQWQWRVQGFWRKQYYATTDEHRLIWIEDYVKGPKDKPMKPPQHTIYRVAR